MPAIDGASGEPIHASRSQDEGPRRGRRHQIPGLRQTPYLKVYIVECEDVDKYRASTRNQLRDWVKDHTPTSQSSASINKQDNHDAFEWLIIHVILAPGEGSNWSGLSSNAKADTEGAKKPSISRWSSRSSRSVIEKIRLDFNGTSKNAIDRVAQVQLPEASADSNSADRRTQDDGAGWEDLIGKLKSLILASFDLRVQQYEEDIKEKELQRSLPGWNFNTFFVLKEGLARGFESVGLVEDALTGYHELATSLGTIVDDELHDQALDQQTTRFVESTDDLHQAYAQAIRAHQDQRDHPDAPYDEVLDLGTTILDTERKPFRDLILSNEISAFDFQGYVFARQVCLLLRLANAGVSKQIVNDSTTITAPSQTSIKSLAKANDVERENLLMLADVCRLSLNFITSSAWTIRRDIGAWRNTVTQNSNADGAHTELPEDDITENIVASWTFSACRRILSATSARSLSLQVDPPLQQLDGTAQPQVALSNTDGEEGDSLAYQNHFPRRTSSLSFRSPSLTDTSAKRVTTSATSPGALWKSAQGTTSPGVQELAAFRGDLFSLSRRTLNNLAYRCEAWKAGFSDALKKSAPPGGAMEDVELSDGPGQQPTGLNSPPAWRSVSSSAGMLNAALKSAMQSKENFFATFEVLTKTALAHYVIGDRSKMAEAMTADLAVLCFQLRDYNAAASYFKQLASFYNDGEWVSLGTTMLDMWAESLEELDHVQEYVSVALRALASACTGSSASIGSMWSLKDLIRASAKIHEHISVPFDQYFLERNLDPYISHYTDHDGFKTTTHFRSMLSETFEAKSVQVRIVSIAEEQQSEVWLSSAVGKSIKPGMNKIEVGSKVY